MKLQHLDLLPRSEILSRIEAIRREQTSHSKNPTEKVLETVRETKSLDTIPQTLTKLSELRANTKPESNVAALISDVERSLSSILQAYKEYQAGLLIDIERMPKPQVDQNLAQVETIPLRTELIRMILPNLLKAPKLEPKESVAEYLDRVMAVAQETVDARMIVRVQNIRDFLSGKEVNTKDSLEQLRTTIAGKNLEEAGHWMLALTAYHQALESGGVLVPAKAIGKRIEAIQAAHPEAFSAPSEKSAPAEP